MKKLWRFLFLFFALVGCGSAVTPVQRIVLSSGAEFSAQDSTCAGVMAAMAAAGTAASGCSSDPVVVGTVITLANSAQVTVQSISNVCAEGFQLQGTMCIAVNSCPPSQTWNTMSQQCNCNAGSHFDLNSQACVADVSDFATCVPSSRTIAPCPSGFAPTKVVIGGGNPNTYPSFFDAMSVQDVVVACAYVILFILGISFGGRGSV